MACVEAAARRMLASDGVDLDSLAVPEGFEQSSVWTLALVAEADGAVVGMARLTQLDQSVLSLDQVSVDPGHARSGIGRQLLQTAAQRARELGYQSIVGTTFRDIPFNAPFYAALQAVEDGDPHPTMLQRRAVETDLGLDDLGQRIIMRLWL
jgi:GNAT superfamily N-acetyltransferase